ncbi:MAG: hypothetical protein U0264_12505 [Candidatus Kapaibacterium sp.]
MHTTLKYLLIIFLCSAIAASLSLGCASENPNLVNPPSGLDSIYIRLINFTNDNQQRILSLAGAVQTTAVSPLSASETITSPSDSAVITIIRNGSVEYKPYTRLRFSRTSYQSIVALPSSATAPVKRALDTLIALYTPYHSESNNDKASVRMMNCIADSGTRYSLRLGCANGAEIAFDNGFRSQSGIQELPPGNVGITLVRRDNDKVQALDLFECTLSPKGAYTFFVLIAASTGKATLYMLDERNTTPAALRELVPIPERTASIRTVNLSKSAIDVDRLTGQSFQTITRAQPAGSVTDYLPVGACESFTADSFTVTPTGSAITSVAETALEALQRYTLLAFDNSTPRPAMIVPQFSTAPIAAGKALVRVVNAMPRQTSMTVSLGAYTDLAQATGFSSGTILASRLTDGNYSDQTAVVAGELPITVFTSGSPAQLLLSTVAQLESQKKYLLVFWNDNQITRSALIEESQTSGAAGILEHGAFVEIVHAYSSQEKITCGLNRVVSNATLFYGNSLATVLPGGTHTLTSTGGVSIPFTASTDSTVLALITGATNSDVLFFTAPEGTVKLGQSIQRYINACKEIPEVFVTRDSLNGLPLFSKSIPYRSKADTLINYERRTTLVFSNAATKEELYRVENVSLPLGKNYAIIFVGANKNYHAIIQQEF